MLMKSARASCSSVAVPVSPIAFAAITGSTNDSGRTRYVILNDECPYTGGPIQKLKTSQNWEDYAGRKLMRWSDVCKPDRASSCRRFWDPNPMIINRRGD